MNCGTNVEFSEWIEQDLVLAARFYWEGARQGDPLAMCNLAWCYEKGAGVPSYPAQAFYWYKTAEAADLGEAAAQCNLGWCY